MARAKEIDCNDCDHINITETRQDQIYKEINFRPVHVCCLHNKQIRHNTMYGFNRHPELEPCVQCGGASFKKVEVNDEDL